LLPPLRGSNDVFLVCFPWADAHGYMLSPLRGCLTGNFRTYASGYDFNNDSPYLLYAVSKAFNRKRQHPASLETGCLYFKKVIRPSLKRLWLFGRRI
jgi:hypothetical protein